MTTTLSLSQQTSRAFFQAFAPVADRLLPQARTQPAAPTGVSLERRLSFLRQHGNFTLAYSAAVQKGLEYFGNERGFIAYKMVGGTALVLADPVAAVENRAELIRDFMQAKRNVSFWQVSRATAEILSGMGFAVNEMGTDIRLDLPTYKRKSLRHDFNRSVKDGYVTKESTVAEVGLEAVREVSDRWRETRTFKDREVAFLNRPVVLEDEPDVRQFFTFDRDGKLVAFSFYDPIYEDGQVVGYSTSFKRRIPECDSKILQRYPAFRDRDLPGGRPQEPHPRPLPDGRHRGQRVPRQQAAQPRVPRRVRQQAVQPLRLPAARPCLAQARLQGHF